MQSLTASLGSAESIRTTTFPWGLPAAERRMDLRWDDQVIYFSGWGQGLWDDNHGTGTLALRRFDIGSDKTVDHTKIELRRHHRRGEKSGLRSVHYVFLKPLTQLVSSNWTCFVICSTSSQALIRPLLHRLWTSGAKVNPASLLIVYIKSKILF
jgi:hypothetical protein